MSIRSVASFIRWRLLPSRYLQTLSTNRRVARQRWAMPSREMNDVQTRGYAPGPSLGLQAREAISAIYRPRTAEVQARTTGHPFVNQFRAEDIRADNPVVRFAFSEAVLGRAAEYFGNQVTRDSIQVLYSYPTEGAPRESQLWHKDYGDSRSLHCMTYLNDVQEPQGGLFAFVDRADRAHVRRSSFVRRIDDAQFARELGEGEVRYLKSTAGTSEFVDAAACLSLRQSLPQSAPGPVRGPQHRPPVRAADPGRRECAGAVRRGARSPARPERALPAHAAAAQRMTPVRHHGHGWTAR